jgi:S-adenosylmethionine-diacylglycerol 3-amino-3-carboxypropyl transferase
MRHSVSQPIEERASFETIRYANCWEDAPVLVRGLLPLQGTRCLSIASAGDNVLSLLARGAADVVAVDLSPAQLALVDLKMAAFRCLTYEDLLGFLGVRESGSRRRLYQELRTALGSEARAFWDARQAVLEEGVIHSGRLERYFSLFRRALLPLIHTRATVESLLQARGLEERRRFYDELWDNRRWRAAVSLFFGRRAMGRLGRDPEFLRYATGPVGARILERARHALIALPTQDNPYLNYILTGRFGVAPPDYLRPEHYTAIRRGLDRVQLRRGPVEDVVAELAPHSIDAFNLSDVAEYMDIESYHRLLERLHSVAAPGARLAYWNLLAARQRAFFYGAFVLEFAR